MTHEESDLPKIVSRQEWREARARLLEQEKAHTHAYDALSRRRRELPMVLIDKEYRFQGPKGEVGLLDLFDGLRQLVVVHFMFDPAWDEGCKGCTGSAEEVSAGVLAHLRQRDTAMVHVSRAPLAKVQAYQAKRGLGHLRWYSSFGDDFNVDFGATIDEQRAPFYYNYRSKEEHLAHGSSLYLLDAAQPIEVGGCSAFLRIGDRVFHTFSAFARGTDTVSGSYSYLDLTALGRQEEWEEPKGRVAAARASVPFFE
ncbi:MAG: DUF899 domain-containing protein [Trueperaceae bacterium]|nr:DUF899 domain-containing protein [Trueperaceae bacterium]